MSTYKTICITSRQLVDGDFFKQIQKITALSGSLRPSLVILREKDLSPASYQSLAQQVQTLCADANVPFAVHSQPDTGIAIQCHRLHVPFPAFCNLSARQRAFFSVIGTSVHSREEARQAEALGASYVIAGHIFATDCKKGVPPRGLSYLHDICQSVSIPVYAIGGITLTNAPDCIAAGAAGVCMMSSYMKL